MKNYSGVDVYMHIFLTSALTGSEWSAPRSYLYSREKSTPVLIGLEAGWASETLWTLWRRENSWPYRDSKCDLSVVQPIASLYTNYIIPALRVYTENFLYNGTDYNLFRI
jgi:hypothetical protein